MEKIDVNKLPKNIEAEQALLGALLVNNKAYEKIADLLKPAFFADATHQKIYEVMSRLLSHEHTADIITLKGYFEQEGTLNEVGGFQYLAKLADGASPLTNVEYYAQFIYDKYLRRELVNTGYEIVNDALLENLDESALEQIDNAEKALYNLAEQGDTKGNFIEFPTTLNLSLKLLERAIKNQGKLSGVSTGLNKLDYKIGGLNNAELLILAARPGMGKTSLAINIAYNVAELHSRDNEIDANKRGVAFFSLEMSAEELGARILSFTCDVPSNKMRVGEIDEAQFNRVAEMVRTMQTIPLYIDDTPGLSINTIRARARRLKRRTGGLGLIVVDYIQLLSGGNKKSEGNRVQEVSEISRGLKILAKELDIPVLAISQLNRSVENRDEKMPQMADLRESGSIEQDADIVMFIYRENYYIARSEPKRKEGESEDAFQKKHAEWEERERKTRHLAEVNIAKNRHGPIGPVQLSWKGETTSFGNLIEDDHLPEAHG